MILNFIINKITSKTKKYYSKIFLWTSNSKIKWFKNKSVLIFIFLNIASSGFLFLQKSCAPPKSFISGSFNFLAVRYCQRRNFIITISSSYLFAFNFVFEVMEDKIFCCDFFFEYLLVYFLFYFFFIKWQLQFFFFFNLIILWIIYLYLYRKLKVGNLILFLLSLSFCQEGYDRKVCSTNS